MCLGVKETIFAIMRVKKKNEVGTARIFMTQRKAMNKLQLSLKDFRRLCILKGVYPREPNHIKKANKGSTQSKIFYHIKDINHLASEPLINKFREQKIFFKKLTTAKKKKEEERRQSMLKKRPELRLDSVVRERYPTFQYAIQDLDDALCLCFAFAALSQSKVARHLVIAECKRLTTEFMHYVIESNSLRKVFVSIKGIYYQAEIMGEKVTWLVGHERSVIKASEVDLTIMATFVDFYVTMLSFVNFRLYKTLGLFYPPKLVNKIKSETDYFNEDEDEEKIYSLATPIDRVKKADDEDVIIDTFENGDPNESNLNDRLKKAENLRTLFSKFKFFLNREVPKEPLAFIIRSCGGTVSWDGCPTNLYPERSPLITHQIVDRPITNFNVNRIFIQPQWVFDSFNIRRLLPTTKYAPGATLPPHLSPFIEESEGDYVPLEKLEQLRESGHDISKMVDEKDKASVKPKNKATAKQSNEKKRDQKENSQPKPKKEGETSKMKVKTGRGYKENPQKDKEEQIRDLKLREMMVPKKYRRVYKKIKFGEKRKAREIRKLQHKRSRLETNVA